MENRKRDCIPPIKSIYKFLKFNEKICCEVFLVYRLCHCLVPSRLQARTERRGLKTGGAGNDGKDFPPSHHPPLSSFALVPSSLALRALAIGLWRRQDFGISWQNLWHRIPMHSIQTLYFAVCYFTFEMINPTCEIFCKGDICFQLKWENQFIYLLLKQRLSSSVQFCTRDKRARIARVTHVTSAWKAALSCLTFVNS